MILTSANSTTQTIPNHHLERFAALDVPGVLADYAPDSGDDRADRRVTRCARHNATLSDLVCRVCQARRHVDLQQQVIEGDVGYIRWVAETPDNTYELGTDTFFVRHGKITVKTFAFKATPKA